ncbi:MAG TPA: EAL domain-containing protein [Myxococcota bacterium]|nr:EAL domain-containing protein [Myxococcota bacterium]HRY93040.1 EAL domain-containing protein [Myxococcota bacterium]HSA21586.1 EAL domain-containing protein [Myxococcota bacterium]
MVEKEPGAARPALPACDEVQNERLAAFPRESPYPIVECDREGFPIYLNPAAEERLRALGVDLTDLLPLSHVDIVRACMHEGERTSDVESAVGEYHFSWTYQPVPALGVVHIYGQDVTARRRAEERLVRSALMDALTGLPNRALLTDRLQRNADLLERHPDYCFAVLLLDLDRFQMINESLGHAGGDRMLVEVTRRLGSCVKQSDTVARVGGDEFVILLEDIGTPGNVTRIADRIQSSLAGPFSLGGREVFVGASLGITLACKERHEPADLLRDAETAMYRAKSESKGRYKVFDQTMHAQAVEQLQLEGELRRALEREELVNHYQPIFSLRTGRVAGCEALVRWQHPQRGLLPPAAFIGLAEAAGLIGALGAQVMALACQDARSSWADPRSGLYVSVNLSADQLHRPDLAEQIAGLARSAGLPPAALKVEITESMAARDAEATIATLVALRAHGIQVMIDDFGTGYSSLAYLKHFPLDVLKIDRAFVKDLTTDPGAEAITTTIILLAHALGCEVVAEGVETEAQLDFLRKNGCDFVQGFLLSRPLPLEAFQRLLASPPRVPGVSDPAA